MRRYHGSGSPAERAPEPVRDGCNGNSRERCPERSYRHIEEARRGRSTSRPQRHFGTRAAVCLRNHAFKALDAPEELKRPQAARRYQRQARQLGVKERELGIAADYTRSQGGGG